MRLLPVRHPDLGQGPARQESEAQPRRHRDSARQASLPLVCAEVRAKAIERAALRLNCSPQDLIVADGRFVQNGKPTEQDYWTVADEIDLTQKPTGSIAAKPASSYRFVGQSVPRIDMP